MGVPREHEIPQRNPMNQLTPAPPLANQVALITGAGRGIGAAIATKLAALGAQAVLCGRSHLALEQTANTVKDARNKAAIIECDVADLQSVQSLAERVERTFHRLDI